MKTRTCIKCKGKGIISSPVVHCGVPGGCYSCDMTGKQDILTKAERLTVAKRRWDGSLEAIADRAARKKASHDRRVAASKERAIKQHGSVSAAKEAMYKKWADRLEIDLEQLREEYRNARRQIARLEAGKVTAKDCGQIFPHGAIKV